MTFRSRLYRRSYLSIALTCFSVCFSSVWFSSEAKAIEFAVNVKSDAVDANPGDRLCQTRAGFCSLRAAIQETNALPGADTISLPAGAYPVAGALTNEDDAQSGDLDIRDDLVIRGAGAQLTRITGAKNVSGVFSILSNNANANPTVSIEQLAIAEALDNVDGGVIYTEGVLSLRNVSVEDGGLKNAAVYALDTSVTIEESVFERNNISVSVLRSQLTVRNSQFKNSQLTSGAPILINESVAQIDNNVFQGNQNSTGSGAISAINSKAVITSNTFKDNSSASTGSGAVSFDTGTYSLKRNKFSGNTSARSGGAISSNAAMYIENNTFENNVSGRSGGAIDVSGLNRVAITDSFFDGNNAAENCGAVSIQRANTANLLVVENSIFRNNVSGDAGGAICFDNNVKISHSEFTANVSRTNGGAMYSSGNGSAIINSTISGNLAVSGAAVYQKTSDGLSFDLRHVTIIDNASTAGNTASIVSETGRLLLSGTIVIAKGTDKACGGNIVSRGYNFASDNSCALDGLGDIPSGTALLGALVPYGLKLGSTSIIPKAHVPATGSPVLGKVPTDQCSLLDQAYKNRASVQCDIGAVQLTGTDVLVGVVQFGEPLSQVSERGGTATVKVSRVDGNFGVIGVHFYDTEQASAVPGSDYEVVEGQYLEWADGDATDKLIAIVVYDDNEEEGAETIQFALAGASGGAAIGGMADTTVLSIVDDDTSQSVFAFEASLATVTEAKSEIVVNIIRTEDSVGAASINVATANGTAIAGEDYTEVNGVVNFPAGESKRSVTIPILSDDESENDESFSIRLSNPSNGASLGAPSEIGITISTDTGAVGSTSGTTSGQSTGTTPGGTTDGSTGSATVGTDGVMADGSTSAGGATVSNDQPGAANEPAPGTVITVGSARGGGGSFGLTVLFVLLFGLGYRKSPVSVRFTDRCAASRYTPV